MKARIMIYYSGAVNSEQWTSNEQQSANKGQEQLN